jgi:protein gp37
VKATTIAWCDHTFNPWWGCVKVSPGCTNCYAASMDKRIGGDHWGERAARRFFGGGHWSEPLRWNAEAKRTGQRHRVFCASMADVFEDRDDLIPHRDRLWSLIKSCDALDWLLLTKRPENIARFVPWTARGTTPWRNVWLGTTAENQEYADLRIPILLATPAIVHFISAEPLVGPLTLKQPWIDAGLNWVIAGAESGARRRTAKVEWLQSLRDQCHAFGVAYFLKQAAIADGARLITIGDGSVSKFGGQIIELPYLEGVQHTDAPRGVGDA